MNTIIAFFQNQVKEEAEITRKFLKIIPEDKYDWKPHPKSMSLIGWPPISPNYRAGYRLAIDTRCTGFCRRGLQTHPG